MAFKFYKMNTRAVSRNDDDTKLLIICYHVDDRVTLIDGISIQNKLRIWDQKDNNINRLSRGLEMLIHIFQHIIYKHSFEERDTVAIYVTRSHEQFQMVSNEP